MIDALLSAHGLVAYLLIVAALLGSAFGLPIPEDVSLILAGVLVASDNANLGIMALVCYLGILAGDLIIYRLGWITGPRLLKKRWIKRYMTTSKLQALRANLHKKTFVTIFLARHLFYLRTITFLVCGAVRISFTRFLIADAIAALITTPLMLGVGFLFAEHYNHLLAIIREIKLLLVFGGLAVAGYLYYRFRKRVESNTDMDDGSEDNEGEDDDKKKSLLL